jgi:hypothetical protein
MVTSRSPQPAIHARVAEIREHVVAQSLPRRDGARQDTQARLREHFVAADMLGVHAGVDDVADRQRRELSDSGQHVGGFVH